MAPTTPDIGEDGGSRHEQVQAFQDVICKRQCGNAAERWKSFTQTSRTETWSLALRLLHGFRFSSLV